MHAFIPPLRLAKKWLAAFKNHIIMAICAQLNLYILPLDIIDGISHQKCILPTAVFKSCKLRPGTWMKCKIKGYSKGYSVCQVYPRDIDTRCCYMDNCVGTAQAEMITNNYLCVLEPIENQIRVDHIEITFEIMEQFFSGRLRQVGANMLGITAKQILAGFHLTVGCAIRTTDAKRLGIAAIYIDSCAEVKENETLFLDDQTEINIKNFHIGTVATDASDTPPQFFKYGYEVAWKDLEDLLAVTRLSQYKMQFKRIRPHLNVLLVGPPGCGKTTMLNTFVAKHKFNCFHITTDNILQQYPGDTEAALRTVFDNALHLHTQLKAGDPTVIIIENLELLCPTAKSATMEAAHSNRICTQLMNLLDEHHKLNAGIFCIATTSDPFKLNATARRPGRFQHEVAIDWPNEETRKMLFNEMFKHSQTKPFSYQLELNETLLDFVGKRTQGFVAGDLALLIKNIERQQLRLNGPGKVVTLVKTALNEVKPTSVHASDVEVRKITEGFEFIGGMDKLKRTLEVNILAGLRQKEIYKIFGLKLPKGLLLYGPPGCAKTTFAKCLAKEADMTFISTSGAEVYSPYVGCAEKLISKIFDTARKNAPCLIFFDEIDTLAGRRPIGSSSSNDIHLRILSTLLTEMDGVVYDSANSNQNILVVAASNRPDMIDDALLRPGRLSKHIYVAPPDLQSRIGILQLRAKRMPFGKCVNLTEIAEATDFYTGADMCNLCNEAALIAFQRIEDTQNSNCEIIASDFLAALKITTSSLSSTQMGVYLKFHRKRENT
ncbi:uncharacterized protein [Eurosta solidaginis]|uniref:uncharacterized protein n=1 Tax=Eurosta solidaginis TaxID=178769 RepID=UPI003530CEC2